MAGLIPLIFGTLGLIVGVLMVLHIFSIAGISPFALWIPLTIGTAIGCAVVVNWIPKERGEP